MTARERLDRETAALKSVVYGLVKGGEFDMARAVTEGYAAANPADPDLDALKELVSHEVCAGVSEKMRVLDGVETVFILDNAFSVRNGTTASVLRKTKLMEDKWGYRPLILVCCYDIELRRFLTHLRRGGIGEGQIRLSGSARVLNVYDYFQKSYADGLEIKSVYEKPENGREIEDGVFGVYDGDVLVRKEHFTGISDSLRSVEYFEGGLLAKENIFDDWGYLSRSRVFCRDNNDNNGAYRDSFYTTGGEVCIIKESGKITVFEDGAAIKECDDDSGLLALCLERIINGENGDNGYNKDNRDTRDNGENGGKRYILCFEDGIMAKAAGEIEKDNAVKIHMVHSIFHNDPYDPQSRPQPYYKYLCANYEKFGGIVFLTESEREDFLALYGGNTFVIPHPYPYAVKMADSASRNPLKAVVISRLDAFKQVNHAVDIFGIVVKSVSAARLYIYGHGDKEDEIKEQITRLGLDGNVFVMGITNDPMAVLRGAALSMTTSIAEGYGLVTAESICNGCPAFAYDIKYGPSDIIKHGETGFIIPRFDKEEYAQKLIEFFGDAGMREAMSANAYADAGRFSVGGFLESWYCMTKKLLEGFL